MLNHTTLHGTHGVGKGRLKGCKSSFLCFRSIGNVAIFSKKRVRPNEVGGMILVGDVEGKKCVLVDDMCDTGGTLCKAADMLMAHGATEVHALVSHGVFSDPALEKISNSCLGEFIVTDTIPMDEKSAVCPKLTVISVSSLLAESIKRIHSGESLSALFDHVP